MSVSIYPFLEVVLTCFSGIAVTWADFKISFLGSGTLHSQLFLRSHLTLGWLSYTRVNMDPQSITRSFSETDRQLVSAWDLLDLHGGRIREIHMETQCGCIQRDISRWTLAWYSFVLLYLAKTWKDWPNQINIPCSFCCVVSKIGNVTDGKSPTEPTEPDKVVSDKAKRQLGLEGRLDLARR